MTGCTRWTQARTLKTQLSAPGLTYLSVDTLTFSQMQELLQIFLPPDGSDLEEAKALLDRNGQPVRQTMGNEGAVQLMNEVTVQLDTVGPEVPAGRILSFQEVADLAAVWDEQGSDSDYSAAAKRILGMN